MLFRSGCTSEPIRADSPPREDTRVPSPIREEVPEEPVRFPLPGSGMQMPKLGMSKSPGDPRPIQESMAREPEGHHAGAGDSAPVSEEQVNAGNVTADVEMTEPASQPEMHIAPEDIIQPPPQGPLPRTPEKPSTPAAATPRPSPQLARSPAGTPATGRTPSPAQSPAGAQTQKRAHSPAQVAEPSKKSKLLSSAEWVAQASSAAASSSSTALALRSSNLHVSAAAGAITTTTASRPGQILTRTDSGGSLGELLDMYIEDRKSVV